VERLLAKWGPVGAVARRTGERVATEARRIARAEAYDTGDYHDSIGVESGVDEQGRQAAVVKADDWKAGLIEFGTSEQQAKAPLRRGADAAGVRLREGT
jgi:hypothetical protein